MGLPFTEYSEDALVEQPAIALFGELWGTDNTINCLHETFAQVARWSGRPSPR